MYSSFQKTMGQQTDISELQTVLHIAKAPLPVYPYVNKSVCIQTFYSYTVLYD